MATKRENTPLNKWTHPPSLWRRLLETKRPHEYIIQWMVDRTYHASDCNLCVCHPCAVCNNKAEPLFTCKNMRVTCCSCRLKVSLLKQNKHTRNHCWLNPQLPQSHHYPNAPRGGTQRTHATQEGVLLEAAFSFFFGRGKIKFHQRAELQLIFPNPKTVDIHNERAVKQNATHKQKVVSSVLSTD